MCAGPIYKNALPTAAHGQFPYKGGKRVDELKQKVLSSTNSLQDLMKKIPGYEGYHNREARREADKIQRNHIAACLKKEKERLMDLAGPLSRGRDLDAVTEMDRVTKIFDKITDRIRHADYGYAGFFDAIKINEAELDKMYEFDAALLGNVSSIGEAVTALESTIDSGEGLTQRIKAIEKSVKELDKKFDERENLLTEVK